MPDTALAEEEFLGETLDDEATQEIRRALEGLAACQSAVVKVSRRLDEAIRRSTPPPGTIRAVRLPQDKPPAR